MSINAMTNAALARRTDYPAATDPTPPPKTYSDIASAAAAPPSTNTAVNTALQTLTTYFPSEVVILYVGLIAVLAPQVSGQGSSFTSHWIVFWTFALGTSVAVWVAFATKLKADNHALPLHPRTWPLWEMVAATIAFLAWSIGLPMTPFSMFSWYTAAVGGVVVLLTSTLLGFVAPLFQQTLQKT